MLLDVIGTIMVTTIMIIMLIFSLGVIIFFLPDILENILNAKEAWDNFKEVLKHEEDDR